jgi:hypothetical protein
MGCRHADFTNNHATPQPEAGLRPKDFQALSPPHITPKPEKSHRHMLASGAMRNGRVGDRDGLEQAHALSGLPKDGATALEGEKILPERIA